MKITFAIALLILITITNQATAQTDSSQVELNIFPNPNRGDFYITLLNNGAFHSQLYSMDGRFIKTIFLQNGLNYVSIQEPAGVYFLKVDTGSAKEIFKIILK